ncbi:MAG: hypothetical protein GY941_03335 [Planctomycetes bacterium]|nr:hypothetical protein [Planctomycetota bacterium]
MTVPSYWKRFFPDAEKFLHEDDNGYFTIFYQEAEKYQYIHAITAIVPNDKLQKALNLQRFVNAHVSSSGDVCWGEEPFTPWFRVELNNEYYEPLVLSWQCGANYLSSAVIDPKFCMTYQLCPRLNDEGIVWDDRSKPEYKIAKQTLSNRYNWGSYDQVSEVKIRKDYLDRYLSIRKATLVLLFDTQKHIELSAQDKVSQTTRHYEEKFSQGEGRLIYSSDRQNPHVNATISYATIQLETSISSEEEYDREEDLTWPGDTEVMTNIRATSLQNTYKYATIKDEVLSEYQKDPDIIVDSTKFVQYGGQWSLDFSRLGRNHLRVPIKELYQHVNTLTRIGVTH